MMMTDHFVKNSFLIEFCTKIKSTGNFYDLGVTSTKNGHKCVYSVFHSHSLCSVRIVSDTTSNIGMESLERDDPRVLRVINHKIGELTSNRVLSSENLKTHA